MRFQSFLFRAPGSQQSRVAGEIIAPVPVDTALALAPEHLSEAIHQPALIGLAQPPNIFGPEPQEPRQIAEPVVGSAVGSKSGSWHPLNPSSAHRPSPA